MENEDPITTGLKVLATGCLHLLLNRATLEFPSSHVGAPSDRVIVSLTNPGPVDPSFRKLFPFSIKSEVWHKAVVPVLENENNQFYFKNPPRSNEVNLHLVRTNQWSELIKKLAKALIVEFQTNSFLPIQEISFQPPIPSPGEPVYRVLSDSLTYVKFDC